VLNRLHKKSQKGGEKNESAKRAIINPAHRILGKDIFIPQ
jgi:hypothetical protein